ncbi:FAD-binding protein [Thermoleophilia bacterium SCSIO 60948]|nr:FAD-binding protein [Thermoleophilia bacterium SCSIO 60948]
MPAAQTWRNWSRELTCHPVAIERPGTAEDLCAVVSRAAESGQRVRASASGHSFSDVALTDGVMVRLDRLDRILSVDAERGLVRVEAGAVLAELNERLDELGLALENLGDIDRQTLAGAISTATHGTGATWRNLSSQVAAIELATADGQLREIDAESDPETLRAARVGLGALGIIYSVTLRVLPAFTLRRVDRARPLAEVLERLDELPEEFDHFEFYVFPHTDTALCRETTRTDEPPAPTHPAKRWLQEVAIENGAGSVLAAALRRFPNRAPQLARVAERGVGKAVTVDRSHRVFASERRVRFTEMEYCLPRGSRGDAARHVSDALEIASRPDLGVAFPVEVRFAAGDDAFLSPSFERDSLYIAVHHHRRLDWQGYFAAVESMLAEREGRPHWGKRHTRSAADLEPAYPAWAEFAAVRDRLDPDRVFGNDYTDRVLG